MSRTLSGLMSGDTDLTINVNLENITASNVVSGILDTARIPDLSSNKITSDTLGTARIPNLSASKITSGTLGTSRIPDISATKITSDTLGTDRIPNLSASKITSGNLTLGDGNTLEAGYLKLNTVPVSSAGLTSGQVWNDSGTLKIV